MFEKVVILTGSFNPPTLAHLKSIQVAMDHVGADAGFLIATSYEYLKAKMTRAGDGFVLSDDIRRDMLLELGKVDPRLIFDGHEEHHTRETIARVKNDNPNAEVYFIAGADKLGSLPHWRNAEDLLSTTKFIVFERGDKSVSSLLNRNELTRKYASSFTVLPALDSVGDVSSTKVRSFFYAGDKKGYRELLVPGVADILDTLDPANFIHPAFVETYNAIRANGMHGEQKARQMVYTVNSDLFPGIEGREDLLAGTKVYGTGFSVGGLDTGASGPRIGCVKSSLVSAVKPLVDNGLNPAVVVAADHLRPCPGYRKGDKLMPDAEICRCSNLSESLYQYGNSKYIDVLDSGVPLKECAYPLDPDFGGIYSPGVTFIREGFRQSHSPLAEPFRCSVISVPVFSEEDTVLNRVRTAFRIALANGHTSLVIGDFAVCNGFPVGTAAAAFAQVLDEPEFSGKFSNVVFAFDEGKGNKRYPVEEAGKYGAFYTRFGRY